MWYLELTEANLSEMGFSSDNDSDNRHFRYNPPPIGRNRFQPHDGVFCELAQAATAHITYVCVCARALVRFKNQIIV